MLPDRVSNPGPLTYESGALPIALRGPAVTGGNIQKCVLGQRDDGFTVVPCLSLTNSRRCQFGKCR